MDVSVHRSDLVPVLTRELETFAAWYAMWKPLPFLYHGAEMCVKCGGRDI